MLFVAQFCHFCAKKSTKIQPPWLISGSTLDGVLVCIGHVGFYSFWKSGFSCDSRSAGILPNWRNCPKVKKWTIFRRVESANIFFALYNVLCSFWGYLAWMPKVWAKCLGHFGRICDVVFFKVQGYGDCSRVPPPPLLPCQDLLVHRIMGWQWESTPVRTHLSLWCDPELSQN